MKVYVNGVGYDVDFDIEEHGSPASYSDPGDPTILCITHIYLGDEEVTDEVWDELWEKIDTELHEVYIPDEHESYYEEDFR